MYIFGTCLRELVEASAEATVPFVLLRICGFIEKHGLLQASLFQEAAEEEDTDVVEILKKAFNEFGDVPLESLGTVSSVTKLLKLFLVELPEPLIPIAMQGMFIEDMQRCIPNSRDFVKQLKVLVGKLPYPAYSVLKYLSHFLLQVSMHEDENGLNCTAIGFIFGPLIFRSSQADSYLLCMVIQHITFCLVSDYYAVFEGQEFSKGNSFVLKLKPVIADRQQIAPLPSSVVPLIPLEPLKVLIPATDAITDEFKRNGCSMGTHVLLLESQCKEQVKSVQKIDMSDGEPLKSRHTLSFQETRKRKEILSVKSSVDVLNKSGQLYAVDELLSKGLLFEGHGYLLETENAGSVSRHLKEIKSKMQGGNISPRPPDPKRRELEIFYNQQSMSEYNKGNFFCNEEKYVCRMKPWLNLSPLGDLCGKKTSLDNDCSVDIDSIGNCTEADSNSRKTLFGGSHSSVSISSLEQRSENCPLPVSGISCHIESERSVLEGWNNIFDCEEPTRSNQHLKWLLLKVAHEDKELVSPSVQNLHQLNSDETLSADEAPLSPSAYESYRFHRSSHMDPSVPPSPPVEQDYFDKCATNESSDSNTVKQLRKKIHFLKKKIKQFEEEYETEIGYKPSHAEKMNFPESKKLMNSLHKARKELKALKEEAVDCTSNWCSIRHVNMLEHVPNRLDSEDDRGLSLTLKPMLLPTWRKSVETLEGDRKSGPECVEDAPKEVECEKFAIQEALSQFGSGNATTTNVHDTVRPLYERNCNIKQLLRSSSFPVTGFTYNSAKGLQPIMEHETMDFVIPPCKDSVNQLSGCDVQNSLGSVSTDGILASPKAVFTHSLDKKYNNSNLHELPLSELLSQRQHVWSEKRRLRKILRQFEAEFLRISGRKVQKEDKASVEALYAEYKLVKARLRLLDALLSKHHEHKFI